MYYYIWYSNDLCGMEMHCGEI